MIIQWYPGHMNKARAQLEDKLSLLDVIVEVVDARVPASLRNPLVSDIVGDKPHIVILSKAGLADPNEINKWEAKLKSDGKFALKLDAQHNTNMAPLFRLIKLAAKDRADKLETKGASSPTIRICLAEAPNCGKSTIINRLAGRNVAIVDDRPSVTKRQSWLKTGESVQILDTPDILWPKFEDQAIGFRLTTLGSTEEGVSHVDDVVLFVMEYLKENYFKSLVKFNRLSEQSVNDLPLPELLLAMIKKCGIRDDYEKMSLLSFNQLRKGRLGRINLEKVEA